MAASSSMISTEPIELVSSRPVAVRLMVASGIDDLSYHREFHGERCALSRRTLYVDLSGVFLNDAVGYRQPQAGAAGMAGLGFGLGGEKRIVDAMNVFLRDAAAGVRHRDADVVPVARGDGERASRGHGVFRVEEQVQEDLLQLSGVAEDRRQVRMQLRHNFDAGGFELVLQQRQRVLNNAIQVDVVELGTRSPREVQQAVDDLRSAERLSRDLVQ